MAGGHISAAVQSASACGWKHRNGGPFRSQTEHQRRQLHLLVLRAHPAGGAAKDRGNPSADVLKYHRQIPGCGLSTDHSSPGGCRIWTGEKYPPVSVST
mgnify:CR=1 FL=1